MSIHSKISYLKSSIRIIAAYLLIFGHMLTFGILMLVAELFGIVEELYVDNKNN